MKRLGLPLILAVFCALAFTPASTPAQEEKPAKPAPNTHVLNARELSMWQAWMRADHAACYEQAQSALADPKVKGKEFRIALALQARCAEALAWRDTFLRDLNVTIAAHNGTDEADFSRWELLRCLRRLGRLDAVAELGGKLGFLSAWWVAGPFPNDRGQGFKDVQQPERDLRLDAEYVGKEGQPVAWRKVPVRPVDGAIDLGAMLRPNTEATAFLLTALWCEKADPEAMFMLGSSNATRLVKVLSSVPEGDRAIRHVDILTSDTERDFGFDQSRTHFDDGTKDDGPGEESSKAEFGGLKAGWNVLLLKAGQSDGDWKIRIRVRSTSPWRLPLDEAEFKKVLEGIAADAPPFQVDGSVTAGMRPYYLGATCELLSPSLDRTSNEPQRMLQSVLAGEGMVSNAKDIWWDHAEEKAVLQYLLAWAHRSSVKVAAGREENVRRALLLECLKADPTAARVAFELAQYYTTTFANPALADEYAAMAVKLRPSWIEARLLAARVAGMKGMDNEIDRELATLMKEFPDHPAVLRMAAYYAGRREDYASSDQMFEAALKGDFTDEYARDRLLERAARRGDTAATLKYAAQVRQLNPFDTHAATQLASMYVAQGKLDLADSEFAGALAIAPRDDNLLCERGEALAMWASTQTGDKQAELRARSVRCYRDALDANPKREDVVRYLEFLDRERPKFEAALQEDITARIKAAIEQPGKGDDPWEVIYRDEITVINDDGTKSFYQQEARLVLNDDGRDGLQTLRAPAWGGQQSRCVEARVFRAAGGIEEGRRDSYGASFANLAVGDVVQARFRVTDREQGFFGDFFGTREVLADFVPVREMRFVYVLPTGREFHEYTTANAPKRVESTVEGRRVWTYVARDIPKLPDETLAPPAEQRAATVQISTYKDWKEWGRWYYNLIRKQLEPTPEMTAKVNELTAGAETEKEKARAVYNWVVTAVRYNADWHFGVHGYKPFSAGAVFARCIGDCKDKAILICAMLRIAGVKAFPVIINLEAYRGEEDITLPMPHHFNHAIAFVEYEDGTSQFLDGTATYNGIDELPGADSGASVIVIKPDGGVRTKVPLLKPEQNASHDEVEAEFIENGGLRLKVKRTAVGDAASGLRARYQREGERKRLIEQEWADRYPGAKVSDISASDPADLNNPPWLKFTVELPGVVTVKDGQQSFTLAPNPRQWGQSANAALTARKTDLLLPAPYRAGSRWTFKLPQGLEPELPDKTSIENPRAKLEVSAKVEKGNLVIERSYSINGGVVKAADYAGWRRDLLDFDKAESFTIRLKPGEQR